MATGLRELADSRIVPLQTFHGLRDTLGILIEQIGRHQRLGNFVSFGHWFGPVSREIGQRLDELENPPATLRSIERWLESFEKNVLDWKDKGPEDSELRWWIQSLATNLRESREALTELTGWYLSSPRSWLGRSSGLKRMPRSSLSGTKPSVTSSGLPTVREVAQLPRVWGPLIEAILLLSESRIRLPVQEKQRLEHLRGLRQSIDEAAQRAADRISQLERLADQCVELAEMDFDFLYDRKRELFAIGYNVTDNRLDSGYYDLLASEARLASYVLIARGDFGQEHWFALGRLLTNAGGEPALLSWSGSMFEYLMPLLVMPTYEGTLLDQTYRAVVRRHINYGWQRGIPWGISESGYNTIDWNSNYQYRAFGVPGLGLKRGLAEDLVIAPYASALALMVVPSEACRNLERLAEEGHAGGYGFFEAVDYTASRVPPGVELRDGATSHGAPCGNESAIVRLRSAGATHAATIPCDGRVASVGVAAARACSKINASSLSPCHGSERDEQYER